MTASLHIQFPQVDGYSEQSDGYREQTGGPMGCKLTGPSKGKHVFAGTQIFRTPALSDMETSNKTSRSWEGSKMRNFCVVLLPPAVELRTYTGHRQGLNDTDLYSGAQHCALLTFTRTQILVNKNLQFSIGFHQTNLWGRHHQHLLQ